MDIVNGYVCRNCTDVELAKKNVDPAHPKDGPNGQDSDAAKAKRSEEKAVLFGGNLSFLNDPQKVQGAQGTADPATTGGRTTPRVDLTA